MGMSNIWQLVFVAHLPSMWYLLIGTLSLLLTEIMDKFYYTSFNPVTESRIAWKKRQ